MTFGDRPRVVILGIGFGGNIGSARPFVLLRRQLTEREKRMTDEQNQTQLVLLGLSVLLSFCAFGMVTILYILSRLRVMRREDAITALVGPHAFRFIGLSFLVPGVVSSALPPAFAMPAVTSLPPSSR